MAAREEGCGSGSEGEGMMESGVCEDLKGLRIEGGGGASGGIEPDEEGVADCLVLDLTHGPSLFGIAAAKEGSV